MTKRVISALTTQHALSRELQRRYGDWWTLLIPPDIKPQEIRIISREKGVVLSDDDKKKLLALRASRSMKVALVGTPPLFFLYDGETVREGIRRLCKKGRSPAKLVFVGAKEQISVSLNTGKKQRFLNFRSNSRAKFALKENDRISVLAPGESVAEGINTLTNTMDGKYSLSQAIFFARPKKRCYIYHGSLLT